AARRLTPRRTGRTWSVWNCVAARDRALARRHVVRRRELSSVRAPRAVVWRDDGRRSWHCTAARAHRALSARLHDALSQRASGFHVAVAARLAVQDLAPSVAYRGAL